MFIERPRNLGLVSIGNSSAPGHELISYEKPSAFFCLLLFILICMFFSISLVRKIVLEAVLGAQWASWHLAVVMEMSLPVVVVVFTSYGLSKYI